MNSLLSKSPGFFCSTEWVVCLWCSSQYVLSRAFKEQHLFLHAYHLRDRRKSLCEGVPYPACSWLIPDASYCLLYQLKRKQILVAPWTYIEFAPKSIFLSSLFNNYPINSSLRRLSCGCAMDKVVPAPVGTMNIDYKESQGLCTFHYTFSWSHFWDVFFLEKWFWRAGRERDSIALLLDQ